MIRTYFSSLLALTASMQAMTYEYFDQSLIGDLSTVVTEGQTDFYVLAKTHNIGFDELVRANPSLNPLHIPDHTLVVLPRLHIVPTHRQDIVVNLAEKRLYAFNKGSLLTYPVGIGREDWETPLGKLSIIDRIKGPSWRPPVKLREALAKDGIFVDEYVPPGPNNPLGQYALRLSIPSYLIHGTINEKGIGMRSSAGCIRLYPENIEELYHHTHVGEEVYIINEPFKYVIIGRDLLVEIDPPADIEDTPPEALEKYSLDEETFLVKLREDASAHDIVIDDDKLALVAKEQFGFPISVTDHDAIFND